MAFDQTQSAKVFAIRLKHYKTLLDEDIAGYARQMRRSVLQAYGQAAYLPVDVYFTMLERGGKRIRGALVCLGYEMSGGTNQEMILKAARVVEMIHAYFLIMDDIQDRSPVRRGGPTAHKLLEEYHSKKELTGSSEHFGISMALNAMGFGNHAAQVLLANLDAPEDLRIKALSILNQTAAVTEHGQSGDIMNEVTGNATEAEVTAVMERKTARYTILNPLHMGMVLAGADCQATDAITPYAMHTGTAFQITDDILGIFGTEFEAGKSPLDDIREGKRTLLTIYALQNAAKADSNFLLTMLGNPRLTKPEFERCKEILQESGALKYAQAQAKKHVQIALKSLRSEKQRWSADGVQFLEEMAGYLLGRTA